MTLAKQKNFTAGPLFSRIILFALPLMATNLLQMLYSSADMIVVGLSSEPDAVGAIGATTPLLNLIVNIFIGFSTGAMVMVARHIGADDEKRVERTVHTAILMSMIFGVLCAALGILVCRPMLRMMGAEERLLDLGTVYARIYFAGVPFISVSNYALSILRAKGDTKTPLYVLSSAGLINVLLNLCFVMFLDLSVEGVALATAIANAISAAVLLRKLMREDGPCRLSLRHLRIDRGALGDILYVGLPAGIQTAMFSISNLIIQSSILQVNNALCPPGSPYQPVVKGNTAAANLENFAFAASTALHQAAVTFTGQNAGAKKYDRVRRTFLSCTGASLLITTSFVLALFLARDPLFALYSVRNGAEGTLEHLAYNAGYQRLLFHLLPFPLFAFLDICNGVARGLKKSISSMLITMIGTCLLRVLWIMTVFRAKGTLAAIFISYPLSWIVTAIAQLTLVLLVLRNRKREHAAAGI